MKTVIVAAGMGTRLWRKTYTIPKTLLPFGNGTILSTIMDNFNKVGISDFVLVVGFQAEYIKDYMKEYDNLGYNVDFVYNNRWNEGNGISVLASESAVGDDSFILSMSDHIVSTSSLGRIVKSDSEHNLLLVDKAIDNIYDIDDATKVKLDGSKIIDIGKELEDYNGVDCGIFRLNNRYFQAMGKALESRHDSISSAIKILIDNDDMEAVFTKSDETWIDIDTPSAYKHSLRKIDSQ